MASHGSLTQVKIFKQFKRNPTVYWFHHFCPVPHPTGGQQKYDGEVCCQGANFMLV
jgi:hypothetical protein